jgi:hypothetical protein
LHAPKKQDKGEQKFHIKRYGLEGEIHIRYKTTKLTYYLYVQDPVALEDLTIINIGRGVEKINVRE